MKTLIADSSHAEFGWELMSWQGYVRKLARKYDKVVVCTTEGLEPVYADFATEFMVHNIPLPRDCFNRQRIPNTPAWVRYQHSIKKRVAVRVKDASQMETDFIVAHGYIDPSKQSFISYGNATDAAERGDVFDLLIHARNKHSLNSYYNVYNWPEDRWAEVVKSMMARGLRVGAVGTPHNALCPEGAVDMRGIPLERLMDMMSASNLVAGPSSGPLHLAALCNIPRLVWATDKFSTSTKMDDVIRYTDRWNPFEVPCIVHTDDQKPPAARMIKDLEDVLGKKGKILVPGASSASKMTKYWADRRKKQGRSYVSYMGKNSDHQVTKLTPELHKLIGKTDFKHGMDYGCGWGRFSGIVFEHCEKLHAVDLIADFRDDLGDNVTFQTVKFPTKIKLPDSTLDLFVAITSLQHIVDEQWFKNVAKEIHRVLAPNAKVVIVDDNGPRGQHVKPRTPEILAKALGFNIDVKKIFGMDRPNSHHIVVGRCRKKG